MCITPKMKGKNFFWGLIQGSARLDPHNLRIHLSGRAILVLQRQTELQQLNNVLAKGINPAGFIILLQLGLELLDRAGLLVGDEHRATLLMDRGWNAHDN